MKQLSEALAWRYATKKFDPTKKVSVSDLESILEAGNLAPSAYGLQPFRIIIVENPDLRAKLREASYGQAQVTDAGTLLVLARRTDIDEAYITEYVERTAKIREMEASDLEGYKASMIGDLTNRTLEARNEWAGKQSYIALGTMIAEASMLGVDTGPMEGFDKTKVDEILGLKELSLESVAYLTLGYRDESDAFAHLAKVRLPLEDFVITK
jgi:nitroreductase / dihydropteridine reductase